MFCGPETAMFVMAVERVQKISFHEGLIVNKCFNTYQVSKKEKCYRLLKHVHSARTTIVVQRQTKVISTAQARF